jgi:putative membrane fusion protein
VSSYDTKIAEIDADIARLKSQITSEPFDVPIKETGYFISRVDGFEEKLNSETVFDLTETDIENIIAADELQENPTGVIGKLVADYTWYMAAVLDTIKLGTVFEGAQVTLRIGSSNQNVKAEIVKLKRLNDGRSIAVFKCDMFLADFIDTRVTQAKLLLEDYSGIIIPNSALRMSDEDGSIGVYIQDGIVASFRKVRQVLSREEYTLVEDTTEEKGYLSLYDNIIVEGRDLHEGKIIG